MANKRTVQSIESIADFNKKLIGFLDKSQKLVLLLDYDGTLSPLADHPDNTIMPAETENTLNWLAVHPQIFVAIISGRKLKDVQSKIGIQNITYAGNHGIEIENPDGTRSDYELSAEIKKYYAKIINELNNNVVRHGAWIEDKVVSLTFHYRKVPEALRDDLKTEAIRIIESNGFRANPAHCAIEAKPPVNWNKGEAARHILIKQFGNNWESKVRVIFAGDDATDEDVMKVMFGKGKTFRISTDPNIETYADFRLNSTKEVTLLLKWLKSIYE